MSLLLDTHAFLWWVSDDGRLTARARRAIAGEPCVLSVVSCWEMGIKASLGKLEIPFPLDRFIADQLETNGFGLLPLGSSTRARLPAFRSITAIRSIACS